VNVLKSRTVPNGTSPKRDLNEPASGHCIDRCRGTGPGPGPYTHPSPLQGYLAHKRKHRPRTLQQGPRTLQQGYAQGPIVVLGRWAVFYERGTHVTPAAPRTQNVSSSLLLSSLELSETQVCGPQIRALLGTQNTEEKRRKKKEQQPSFFDKLFGETLAHKTNPPYDPTACFQSVILRVRTTILTGPTVLYGEEKREQQIRKRGF